jgi:RNA polymerase sigma-70 factor (ECF subfamily)
MPEPDRSQDSKSGWDPLETRRELINELRAGDSHGWKEMDEKYTPIIARWAVHAGLQSADVQDVVQNVLLAVHQNVKKFQLRDKARKSFRPWLWQITRTKIIDRCRDRANGATLAPEMLDQFESEQILIENADHGRRSLNSFGNFLECLVAIEREFAPHVWASFMRTAVEGEQTADVARDLGISTGAVRVYKKRVLDRLREFAAAPKAES